MNSMFGVIDCWKCLSLPLWSCDWLWNSRATISFPWIRWDLTGICLWLLLQSYFSLLAIILNISLSIQINLPLALTCFMSRAIYSDGSAWLASFKLIIFPVCPLTSLWLSIYMLSLALHNLAGQLLFLCPYAMCGCSSFSLIGQ